MSRCVEFVESSAHVQVESIGHECDLAVLRVHSEHFWETGLASLTFGDVPELHENVAVVGYPDGREDVCVVDATVSQVTMVHYAHAAAQLMAIELDANVDPGNSGGPALLRGQTRCDVDYATTHLVPAPVVQRFLAEIHRRGHYALCSLGLTCQPMENGYLRGFYRLPAVATGVLVSTVAPTGAAARSGLQKDDVIMQLDGAPVANDGTVQYRERERLPFDYLVCLRGAGETANVTIWRDGGEQRVQVPLEPLGSLVPVHSHGPQTSYLVCGGLVFLPLSQGVKTPYFGGVPWMHGVVLVDEGTYSCIEEILAHGVNQGYADLKDLVLRQINGQEVRNMQHLAQLLEKSKDGFVRLDLDEDRVLVLNKKQAQNMEMYQQVWI
eukprot:gene2563-3317_t